MDVNVFARWALRVLPLLLLLTGAATSFAAVLAWGAATHVEIPAWMTTFVGLIFGLPAVIVGALVLREVAVRTRRGVSLFPFQMIAGVALMLVAVALEAGLAVNIANSQTYDNLRDQDGTINTSPGGFLFLTAFPTFLMAGAVGLAGYLYAQSISPSPASRYDRQPGEDDALGEMLRGKVRKD